MGERWSVAGAAFSCPDIPNLHRPGHAMGCDDSTVFVVGVVKSDSCKIDLDREMHFLHWNPEFDLCCRGGRSDSKLHDVT